MRICTRTPPHTRTCAAGRNADPSSQCAQCQTQEPTNAMRLSHSCVVTNQAIDVTYGGCCHIPWHAQHSASYPSTPCARGASGHARVCCNPAPACSAPGAYHCACRCSATLRFRRRVSRDRSFVSVARTGTGFGLPGRSLHAPHPHGACHRPAAVQQPQRSRTQRARTCAARR